MISAHHAHHAGPQNGGETFSLTKVFRIRRCLRGRSAISERVTAPVATKLELTKQRFRRTSRLIMACVHDELRPESVQVD